MAKRQPGYAVVITPEAGNALQEIVEYLEENASFERAKYVLDAILKGLDTLLERPESHGLVKEINDGEIIYRRVLVLKGKYLIVYTVVDTLKEVRVIDIMRSGRGPEYMKRLKNRM
jgi:plasmid stabilization system protein ParE